MNDKPRKQPPVPEDWPTLLTEQQKLVMQGLLNFGWRIHFIRRPLFQERTVVLKHDQMGYRELTEDGFFDKPFYDLRDEDFE